jgi:predicted DNA-binding protein
MIGVSLRLPAEMVNTLRERADREGKSFTAIVERILSASVQ